MPDNDVLTGKAWRFSVLFLGIVLGIVLVGGTFITLRLRETYRMQSDLVKLMSDHGTLQGEVMRLEKAYGERFDDLERVLFGDVVAKLLKEEPKPVQAPLRLQNWMMNRDKDMRERLERIERRLMKIESSGDR